MYQKRFWSAKQINQWTSFDIMQKMSIKGTCYEIINWTIVCCFNLDKFECGIFKSLTPIMTPLIVICAYFKFHFAQGGTTYFENTVLLLCGNSI